MVTSTVGECGKASGDDVPPIDAFATQEVGNAGYLQRHNAQMFEEGRSFSGNERDKLFLNRGDGTFADLSDLSGCDSPNDGRAVIAADFDDDGDVDLFVHELQRERHALYRNDLGALYGGFLKLRLHATTGQWEAIGATVDVVAGDLRSSQVATRGAGFVSCQPPELVFGLGEAAGAEVTVRWPGGAVESFGALEADARYLLVEGSGVAEPVAGRPTRLPDPLPVGLRKRIGDRVPPFAALDREGRSTVVDPAVLAGGQRTYLNFWASYCGPCVAELPLLAEIHDASETNVIALSMDAPADRDTARAQLAERGPGIPAFFVDGIDSAGEGAVPVGDLVDLERLPIPTTLVLAPDGTIEEILRGPVEAAGGR